MWLSVGQGTEEILRSYAVYRRHTAAPLSLMDVFCHRQFSFGSTVTIIESYRPGTTTTRDMQEIPTISLIET